jgi:hypothetical protein
LLWRAVACMSPFQLTMFIMVHTLRSEGTSCITVSAIKAIGGCAQSKTHKLIEAYSSCWHDVLS